VNAPIRNSLLTLNAGSATLKFAVFSSGNDLRRVLSGLFERKPDGDLTLEVVDARTGEESGEILRADSPAEVLAHLSRRLDAAGLLTGIGCVGHRIVHGGSLQRHVICDAAILEHLKQTEILAPEHLPREREYLERAIERFPSMPQVLCFDTVFHAGLPDVARTLALPRRYEAGGVRRYGFHGLSYEYLLAKLGEIDEVSARGRVILAHLGSGASMAAVRDGGCIDTTMGFTPSGGLVMGTRSGDLDPGVAAYLAVVENVSAAEFSRITSHESGMLGISGISADARVLLEKEGGHPEAALALGAFVRHARKSIGALAAVLGGLDVLVFAGGIGEHSPELRRRICDGLEFLGIRIDPARNSAGDALISVGNTSATVRVIPTDEEQSIARISFQLTNPILLPS
jgi:acetate kinase